jgi:hypothetical protein
MATPGFEPTTDRRSRATVFEHCRLTPLATAARLARYQEDNSFLYQDRKILPMPLKSTCLSRRDVKRNDGPKIWKKFKS